MDFRVLWAVPIGVFRRMEMVLINACKSYNSKYKCPIMVYENWAELKSESFLLLYISTFCVFNMMTFPNDAIIL